MREPTDLCHTFRACVDRATVGLAEVVCAAHHATIRRSVMHREHVAGFVGRDLYCAQEKFPLIGIVLKTIE